MSTAHGRKAQRQKPKSQLRLCHLIARRMGFQRLYTEVQLSKQYSMTVWFSSLSICHSSLASISVLRFRAAMYKSLKLLLIYNLNFEVLPVHAWMLTFFNRIVSDLTLSPVCKSHITFSFSLSVLWRGLNFLLFSSSSEKSKKKSLFYLPSSWHHSIIRFFCLLPGQTSSRHMLYPQSLFHFLGWSDDAAGRGVYTLLCKQLYGQLQSESCLD